MWDDYVKRNGVLKAKQAKDLVYDSPLPRCSLLTNVMFQPDRGRSMDCAASGVSEQIGCQRRLQSGATRRWAP